MSETLQYDHRVTSALLNGRDSPSSESDQEMTPTEKRKVIKKQQMYTWNTQYEASYIAGVAVHTYTCGFTNNFFILEMARMPAILHATLPVYNRARRHEDRSKFLYKHEFCTFLGFVIPECINNRKLNINYFLFTS